MIFIDNQAFTRLTQEKKQEMLPAPCTIRLIQRDSGQLGVVAANFLGELPRISPKFL